MQLFTKELDVPLRNSGAVIGGAKEMFRGIDSSKYWAWGISPYNVSFHSQILSSKVIAKRI